MNLHDPRPERAGGPARDVYSVSRLNRDVRALLEGRFPLLWIEGEISNLSQPFSGHWYFSLKDASAQVRCAMFRLRNMLTGFRPENGMQVLLRARIGLYEPRGEYQLIVESMEPAGDGALRQAFAGLKQRLAGEGLFDAEHKKPLPLLPRQIGIISSPTGAALRDILNVLQRRFPAIPVMIYPVPVQGAAAVGQIAATLRLAGRRLECDVLILARGGGSLEDLWAFNEEPVARAIFDCPIPVVTGIGHETDFTIADFVADQRAPTPSAAAELVSPDCQELQALAAKLTRRLQQIMRQQFQLLSVRLRGLEKRLQHPGQRLRDTAQRLDELELRLRNAQRYRLRHGSAEIARHSARLLQHTPVHLLRRLQDRRRHAAQRLETAMRQILRQHQSGLNSLARALDTVSPLATLERGYAIVRRPDGSILRLAADARPGDRVQALLAKGRINCIIEESLAEAATDNNEKPE